MGFGLGFGLGLGFGFGFPSALHLADAARGVGRRLVGEVLVDHARGPVGARVRWLGEAAVRAGGQLLRVRARFRARVRARVRVGVRVRVRVGVRIGVRVGVGVRVRVLGWG